MDHQNRLQEIVESYIRAYNAFDVEGMLLHLHEEVVFRNISNGEVNLETRDKKAFEAQARQAAGYFQERKQAISSIRFPAADAVEVEIDYHAVLAIDLPNGLKRGDQITLKGRSHFRLVDDHIIEIEDIS